MKRFYFLIIGVIFMAAMVSGAAEGFSAGKVFADEGAVRLITGVRVGEEELTSFQGADNMLMARAVPAETAETELTVHAAEGAKISIDGSPADAGSPYNVSLKDGFNSFTIVASLPSADGAEAREETVYVNVERLPAGLYEESTRPLYHFTPYRHQMNDPNGLVYDAETGLYHLFFQCNRPFASGVEAKTRTTGWGHAVSKNLVEWEEQPMAVTPDLLGAAWSGSGVVDRDNTSGLFDDSVPPDSRLVVFYASVYGDETYGMAKISMAYSKDGGRSWIKYGGNPVVKNTANRYGAGLRDPKVIWYENEALENGGCWLMVTCGNTYLFASNDLISWKVQGGIVRDKSGNVVECECPDLFRLPVDGDENNQKWVLTCGGVSYLLGDIVITDRGYLKFQAETDPIVNLNGIADQIPGIKAPEIYATQTFFTDPLGRRVSMSWIRDPYQDWNDKIWNSAQSIPLVNTLRTVGGEVKLFRYPVAEIDAARSELLFEAKDTAVGDGSGNILSGVRSDCFDLEAVIDPGTAEYVVLAARCGDEFSGAELKVRYSVSENKMYVVKGGEAWQGEYHPEVHLGSDGKLRIRLMQDRICYDVFGGGGEAAVQGIIYTVSGADGLYFGVEGGEARLESLSVWEMSGSPAGSDPSDGGRDDGSGGNDGNDDGNGGRGLTAGKALLIGLGAFFGALLAAGAGFAVASAVKRRRKKGS